MLEDISHLLFLAVLLVYQACLQDSDLHILQGVILPEEDPAGSDPAGSDPDPAGSDPAQEGHSCR